MRITQEILYCYYNNQFKLAILTGELGIGKSVGGMRIGIESTFHKEIRILKEKRKKWSYEDLGKDDVLNWLKTHWFFRIEHYFDYVGQFDVMHREMMCVIDDSGVDVSSQNWQKEIVKEFGIYMQLPRTRWGGIMLTSPLQTNVLKRVRVLPKIWKGVISREYGRQDPSFFHKWRRELKWYERWELPSESKSGVDIVAIDHFHGYIDDFIWKWYEPLRAFYTGEQEQKIQDKIKRRKEKLQKSTIAEPSIEEKQEQQVMQLAGD